MKISESKEKIVQSIDLLYQYINSQVVSIKENGKKLSGFSLDISRTKKERRIGIGSASFGLSLYSFFSFRDEEKVSELEDYIVSRQRPDGGWTISSLVDYNISLVYTTCYALKALIRSNAEKNILHIEKGINWLLSVVNADGAWAIYPKGESHVHPTSEVLHLFSLLKLGVNQDIFLKAKNWLLSKKTNDYWLDEKGLPSLYLTALVYRGLISNGNFHFTLESTRKWLIKQLSKAPCREEIVYYVNIGGDKYLQEPIRCFTRAAIFNALLSNKYVDYESMVEKECRSILNNQNPLGFWNCPSNLQEIPIILNYCICSGLVNYLDYLDRRTKVSLVSKIKDFFNYKPVTSIIIALFFLIGIISSISKATVMFKTLISLPELINEKFTQFSGFANFVTISGISVIVTIAFLIRIFRKRKQIV